jgi:diaminopimelate epimerase
MTGRERSIAMHAARQRPAGTAIHFAKMHGLGNDYVYVDGTQHPVADAPALARWVSDRHVGVGSDGLIMVDPVSPGVQADVRMRMFNADGSEGMMCGNGIRCVAKFAVDRGLSDAQPLRVETRRGVLSVHWRRGGRDGTVSEATVAMGAPILACARIPAAIPGVAAAGAVTDFALPDGFWRASGVADGWQEACGLDPRMTLVSMGNPHAVLWCRDVTAVPLDRVGPFFEHHAWFPERINVHFVQVLGPREVRMRTWERGSGATQACGTGASAVCVAGVLTGRTGSPLLAHLPGGDLSLEWDGGDADVRMTGPAVEVFEGTLDLGARPSGYGA